MAHHPAVPRRQFLKAALSLGGVAMGGHVLSACSAHSHAHAEAYTRSYPATDAGLSSPSARGAAQITIGFVPIACASPLLAAHATDAFAKHGLDVTLRKFSGWADLWTAYATGALDVAHMLSPMPIAIDAGTTTAARPTELAFTQNTNGQALTLASSHHPHVQSAQDLRGMVLGIPFEYSVHALLLRDYLAVNGIDPVSDVELRLLRPADMIAQLSVGTIDGFIGPEPFNQRALATGSGRVFLPTKEMWDNHPCCSIAVAKSVAPHTRDRIVAALHEGASFVDSPHHVHQAAPLLAQEKYLNQPAKLIEPALSGKYLSWDNRQVTDPNTINFGGTTSAAAITWMATQLARWNLGGHSLRLDDTLLHDATRSVLPREADMNMNPLLINGMSFDPTNPTAGYLSRRSTI